jgi:hypothetical protein
VDMHKNIGAAIIRQDEAKPAICVEELHPAGWHFLVAFIRSLLRRAGSFCPPDLTHDCGSASLPRATLRGLRERLFPAPVLLSLRFTPRASSSSTNPASAPSDKPSHSASTRCLRAPSFRRGRTRLGPSASICSWRRRPGAARFSGDAPRRPCGCRAARAAQVEWRNRKTPGGFEPRVSPGPEPIANVISA